ncbi:ATP-binding protein [uncultured Sphaerochaeta sp.]|uniref:ATP-binding protein n=1 Tax=uncultured Sphaerochaeta sp. TaxID=886478 RepID=UPI0029C9E2E9|nr:ATP-binding protein [uncultured Sphaerochaeta sp.]
MFIGREKELGLLEELHASGTFEYLVLYGRRRVGKTSLLNEFSKKRNVIFYSAQAKNDRLNLSDFSKTLQLHFSGSSYGAFEDWNAAFSYVFDQASEERVTLIIDEFPYIAEENPSIKSILQHAIDKKWKHKNIFLILCGSSISFMESEVMGAKSPLYGRATSSLELQCFNYIESARFFPNYSIEEKLLCYGILGGVPCYLAAFNDKKTITKNIEKNILRTGSFLKEETQNLLKMELREPGVYNSIFEAIATGASRLNEIAQKIHEEQTKCSKYIKTLKNMRLVDKVTPSGEKDSSKKSIYQISDNFFLFWYHFIFSNKSYYELLGDEEAAQEIVEHLSHYMGSVFENICMQYLTILAKQRKLPFVPHTMGRWWGGNPNTKKEDDIDILAFDAHKRSAILCECKYRNKLFGMDEYKDFLRSAKLFHHLENRYYYLFSKSGFTDEVKANAQREGITLVALEDLFLAE